MPFRELPSVPRGSREHSLPGLKFAPSCGDDTHWMMNSFVRLEGVGYVSLGVMLRIAFLTSGANFH